MCLRAGALAALRAELPDEIARLGHLKPIGRHLWRSGASGVRQRLVESEPQHTHRASACLRQLGFASADILAPEALSHLTFRCGFGTLIVNKYGRGV